MSFASQNNSDAQMCRQCRGLCCQGHTGLWIDPQRFFTSFDLPKPGSPTVLEHLLPKEIVLRYIDGVAVPAPQKTEAGCIFLEESGCLLPENRRPGQCLALTPVLDTLIEGEVQCEMPPEGSTLTALRNWRTFWEN